MSISSDRKCRLSLCFFLSIPAIFVAAYAVFADPDGRSGAASLTNSDHAAQTLKAISVGGVGPDQNLTVGPHPNPQGSLYHAAAIKGSWMDRPVVVRFPETLGTDFGLMFIDHVRGDMPPKTDVHALCRQWSERDDGSASFLWDLSEKLAAGGQLSPGADEVDLEFWFINGSDRPTNVHTQFCLTTGGSAFEDHELKRSYVHIDGRWQRMCDADRGTGKPELCHYPLLGGPDLAWARNNPGGWGASRDRADAGLLAVVSRDGKHVLSIAWPNPSSLLSNAFIPCIHADPTWPRCPPGRTGRVRGKLYLIHGRLEDLYVRWQHDFGPTRQE